MRRLPNINYPLEDGVLRDVFWFREKLLTWFDVNRRNFPWRNEDRSAYEVVVAEILLQRTTAMKVCTAYEEFLRKYPSWEAMIGVSLEQVEKDLKPLGLWKQKALVFRSLASEVVKNNGVFPNTRSQLEQMPGIGQYIASAILVTFFRMPEPLLDVNMARVLERFFGPRKLVDIRDDPYLQTLARLIVDMERSLHLNWAILDHAALVCKLKKPDCPNCPTNMRCKFYSRMLKEKV